MKKYILNIKTITILMVLLTGCVKDVLDKTPLDRYTGPIVFSDVKLADAYLKDCYYRTRHGLKERALSGVSGECWLIYPSGADLYCKGTVSADNAGPWTSYYDFLNWNLFGVVQKINVFLENIDNVVNSYAEGQKPSIKVQTDRMKGEAIFLRAFVYSQMCMTYGGLPIFQKANKLGDDYSPFTRATFKATVDFIVSDCDEASQLLGLKSAMELGRATKEAALAVKSRILLFAASDLTADGTAQNELVGYNNPDRTALWTSAKNAAKAVMDLQTCQLANFGAPDKAAVSKNYYEFFRAYDLSNIEVIWGKMFNPSFSGEIQKANLWYGTNGNGCWGSMNPTQRLVDSYEMEDGSKFSDHFYVDNSGYYKNKSIKYSSENIYYNREPRFYGSVLYDSAIWQPRFANLKPRDPLGIYERRTHRTIQSDGTVIDIAGIDTRKGYTYWNASYTGYVYKKWQDHTVEGTWGETQKVGNYNVWIELRYAEIILNYAEACLRLNEIQEATTYINIIRNRAALPDFTGDITEALRYERNAEFVFENRRWFDIRRWKILNQAIKDIYGIDIIETKDGNTITTTWQQIFIVSLGPVVDKMYWIPIIRAEMNKAPWLIQNPGY